ncbi:MAG: phospholipase D-like domain-containing protein [Myxococcota bacterium]
MRPILSIGRNCVDIQPVHRSGILVDGEEYYTAFYLAAQRAEHFILVAGWQFDSEVAILRGEQGLETRGLVRLLPFLNELCRAKPHLQIVILAWDYSFIYALEREWMQKVIFDWTTQPNLSFRWDSNHPAGGSHHQKFAIVDGEIGFVGGMDLCEHRWDDRGHALSNPRRIKASGIGYKPYHDVQGFVVGRDACAPLMEIFSQRWAETGGDPLTLQLPERPLHHDFHPPTRLTVDADAVATSRTVPRTLGREGSLEIMQLFSDAILAAEELIYIETQYVSAKSVQEALVRRMLMRNQPLLDIVLVLPMRPGELKERFAVGLSQAKVLECVRQVAESTGHRLGVYYSAAPNGNGKPVATYIHSKLMMVDDQFLTVGSANMTNRSMGLDTELHLAWQARGPDDPALRRSLRRIRVSLLAEHAGLSGVLSVRHLAQRRGLVAYLNALAEREVSRLRLQERVQAPEEVVIRYIDVDRYNFFDPQEPQLLFEEMGAEVQEFFTHGIGALTRRIENLRGGTDGTPS